jgi:hypothetical protein
MNLSDLTATERLVWKAFPHGRWVDLRTGDPIADDLGTAASWGPGRTVRAEVLRALLLGVRQAEPGSAPGIRLRGAYVTGRLDLMGAAVRWPLVCEYCQFDGDLRLVESESRTVRIVHSQMRALNGTRMRLDGILNLWCSSVSGVLRLDMARVAAQVCLMDAQIGAASPAAEAVAASGLTVEGDVECSGLTAHGSVCMNGADVTGSVDLHDARIVSAGGAGLAINHARIGGQLDCRRLTVDGETSIDSTRISASAEFSGSSLSNPVGQALSAGGLQVDGGVSFGGGFAATGEVRLAGARLGANLTLAGARLSNPAGTAVSLDRATVGHCDCQGLSCTGTFSMIGVSIASELNLARAHLDAGTGHLALAGDGAVMDGRLVLTGLTSAGELNLRNARIGRAFLLMGASFRRPGETALRMSGAQVSGDMICGGVTVTGGIRLTGAVIGGRLNLDDLRISNPGGIALSARAVQAGQLLLRPAEPVQGIVDLAHARIEILIDDPATWPGQLVLDGMTYQALEPRLPATERLRWLARDPAGHQAQPYEHLAAHYAGQGEPEQARTILLARERVERQAASRPVRLWGFVQDVTLGYGYRPWRALAWLAVLLIAGSVAFTIDPPAALQASAAPHFNPVIYTLDLLLPLVDLGQRHAFNPSGVAQWLSYGLIAAGWILATTVAAAAARVLRR